MFLLSAGTSWGWRNKWLDIAANKIHHLDLILSIGEQIHFFTFASQFVICPPTTEESEGVPGNLCMFHF